MCSKLEVESACLKIRGRNRVFEIGGRKRVLKIRGRNRVFEIGGRKVKNYR